MARKNKNHHKFEFGSDFQQLILQYIVTDPQGYKVLGLIDDSYFTLVHDQIIAYALKKFYRKEKHVPEEPIIREFLRVSYQTEKVLNLHLTQEDKETVDELIKKLYSGPIKHSEVIVHKVIEFARFIKFKESLEKVDVFNYANYEIEINNIRKAINIGIDIENDYGVALVSGMNDRAHKRDSTLRVTPTPWRQFDKLLNPGGTEEGNVIVILSTEKSFKTGALINIARGYMSRKKKGVYIDLENGEQAITTRAEQSLMNEERSVIQSGDLDNKLMKLCRKYKRIGSDIRIKRMAALDTKCDDLRAYLDLLKRDLDYIPDFLIVDYGLLLGANSGQSDDTKRISDAFIDLKNLAKDYKLDACWTAAHTTREGNKRKGTKFLPTDTAKCMDITKHIDCLLGLQQNEDEEKGGVMRVEVIEQRNGPKEGRMLFWVDIPKQRMREFSKTEIKAYHDQYGEALEKKNEDQIKDGRKKRSDL